MSENKRPNIDAQYIAEQRTVDVLRALRMYSDEKNPISQSELREYITTTGNPQTLAGTIDEILKQINPAEYTGENDDEYRIKYDGYDKPFEENPLVIRSEISELRNEMRRKDADKEALSKEIKDLSGGKAPSIRGLRYVHDFSYEDMDQLISAVALAASIPPEDKEHLIRKIMATASIHYKSPFYDRALESLKFNPYSEYSRIHSRSGVTEKRIGENVRILQDAIRLHTKVRFNFDVYGKDKCYITDEKQHVLSPYYIVIYNDNYYVIGAWDNEDEAVHYRIDLMSSLEIIRDENNVPVSMKPMSECKNLPSRDLSWDPEKYMSEHLYMAYDKARKISIKIPVKKIGRYTKIHDWFGDHFELNKKATDRCEEGYEVIDVVTSPNMIVHWAMQYSEFCEILDEEVREKIRKELEMMRKKYKK